jgi:hypothetical protein
MHLMKTENRRVWIARRQNDLIYLEKELEICMCVNVIKTLNVRWRFIVTLWNIWQRSVVYNQRFIWRRDVLWRGIIRQRCKRYNFESGTERVKLEVFIWRHGVYVPKSTTAFRGILICVIYRPTDMQEYLFIFSIALE